MLVQPAHNKRNPKMARIVLDNWVQDEVGSAVLTKIAETSAVEAFARHEPMASDTKIIDRGAKVDPAIVAKGAAYPEDTNVGDQIVMVARKIGKAVRIAEEDIADLTIDIIRQKQLEWATGYARFLDNATLGTTAVANGTTVPFNSVYYDVTTNAVGNRIQTAGAVTYDDISNLFSIAEGGSFYDEASLVLIAHPSFKASLRALKDDNGAPLYVQGLTGAQGNTLFGVPIRFTTGARTSATATNTPGGNPLVIAAPRELLILGDRVNSEYYFGDPGNGASMLTDEAILKFRARKAFTTGDTSGVGILEVTAGA
jgi:HK97 family phage major capsid protein